MTEEWRPVSEWEGYEVSNLGNVRSYRRCGGGHTSLATEPKILKPKVDPDGYPRVVLNNSGKRKTRGVHQLVAEAFLADSKFQDSMVLHKDDIPSNNEVTNLVWGTAAENIRDRFLNSGFGTYRPAEEVSEMKRLYHMGFTQREIARVFKTTQQNVSELVLGKSRGDVA